MHGARKKETIKRGADHPQYRHGKRTREYMVEQSEQIAELQALEKIGFEIGLLIGPRTRGPKAAKLKAGLNNIYNSVGSSGTPISAADCRFVCLVALKNQSAN